MFCTKAVILNYLMLESLSKFIAEEGIQKLVVRTLRVISSHLFQIMIRIIVESFKNEKHVAISDIRPV